MLLCFACSDDANSLDGSLSQIYQLGFNQVRARMYSTELSIEYLRAGGVVPVRVTVDHDGELTKGTYDLAVGGDVSGRLRNGTEMPKVSAGTITLKQFSAKDGAKVSGNFSARFLAGEDTLGLDGNFSATLELVKTPGAPDDARRESSREGPAAQAETDGESGDDMSVEMETEAEP